MLREVRILQRFRFTHVDLVRGLCAIAVLLTHFALFAHVDEGLHGKVVSPPFYGLLAPIYYNGGWAVEMFWILSGFVFVIAYQHEGRSISSWRFAAWRFSRLYPLNLITFLAMAVIQVGSTLALGEPQIYKANTLLNAVTTCSLSPDGLEIRKIPTMA